MGTLNVFNEESEKIRPGELMAATEQYGIYATSLPSSRNTRGLFHTIFISINSLIFAGIGLTAGNGEAPISIGKWWLMDANIVGVVISVLWWVIIMKYREESRTSLKLLSEAENYLPFRFFSKEYALKKEDPFIVRKVFKHAEPSIPVIFATIHSLIGLGIWSGVLNFGVAL